MPKVRVQIAKSLDATWRKFIDEKSWNEWWFDGLLAVEPYWARSSRMVWQSGPPSTITSLVEKQELTITDQLMIQHFRFQDSGTGRTNLEIEFSANGLTVFHDNGLKMAKILRDSLQRFKSLVEANADVKRGSAKVIAATQKPWWQVW